MKFRHRRKSCPHRVGGCLNEAVCGRKLIVRQILGDENFRTKMIEQGVYPGTCITLISGRKNHPCIFSTGDNRIMMDSDTAELIYVSAEYNKEEV